jgi:hypothetical protein
MWRFDREAIKYYRYSGIIIDTSSGLEKLN